MKTLNLLALAAVVFAFPVHALTNTSETAAFYRDSGELISVPKTPGHVDKKALTSTAVSYTLSIPSWAASASNSKGGLVVFSFMGGNVGVCVWNATANRCASPVLPYPSNTDIVNGTAYDPNPKGYWLEPMAGAAPTSITFITDTSGSMAFAKFYKAKKD